MTNNQSEYIHLANQLLDVVKKPFERNIGPNPPNELVKLFPAEFQNEAISKLAGRIGIYCSLSLYVFMNFRAEKFKISL